MKSLSIRAVVLGLAGVLAGAILAADPAQPQKPNFLWLIAEDFGPALGRHVQLTKNLPAG